MTVNYLVDDARYGRMLVNRNDTYVGKSFTHCGEFSEHEVAAFRALVRHGDVVFDIGANIGAHTVVFSQLVGDKGAVIAFEPQRDVFNLLCANVALNDCWNVETHRMAVGAEHGAITVVRLDPRVPNNFGGLAIGNEQGDLVGMVRLDDAPPPRLDFVKLDVEGMELAVLEGAKQTIAKHRPILYLEADRPANHLPMQWWLTSAGYRIWWHCPPLWNEANHFGATECPFPEGKGVVSINWLCMPDGQEPPTLDYLRPLGEA